MSSTSARVLYPELPDPLTPGDMQRLFSPSYSERGWAPTIARRPEFQLALLVHLKIFQTIGRFLPATQIPQAVVEHVALKMGCEAATAAVGAKRTLHRHRVAILLHLGVASWGDSGRGIALEAMRKAARVRVDPADITNAAIDALVGHRIELPPLAVLRRLAGTAHAEINRTQWAAVCNGLTAVQRGALDALLVVDAKTQRSTFSALCAQPGRPSRKNLEALIERFEWLMHLPDPTPALSGVANVKVMLWANEARRLNALELREYVASRRHTLLLAAIRAARGQVLDELTQMLLRLARKIEHRSQQVLAEWYQSRHSKTDNLIHALRDALIVHGRELAAQEKVAQIEAVLSTHGGRESLARDCDAHLRHERQNWRPFARAIFVPFRSTLLHLAHMLPMQKAPGSPDLLAPNPN
jgi:hypothetical protein